MKRWGWIFLPVGLVVAAMLGSWLWPLAERAALPPLNLRHALTMPYALVALGIAFIPVVWWACYVVEERTSWFRAPVVIGLVVLAVLGVEGAFRSRYVQLPFWFAVRSYNPGELDFFARELSLVKLDRIEAAGRGQPPGLVFAGTSQLMLGIDYDLLRRELPDVDVRRRSIAGMVPFRMACARPILGVGKGDVVVLYISEFDMAGLAGFDVGWLRSVATWEGSHDALSTLSAEDRRSQWRNQIDLGLASTLTLWSTRDRLREFILGKPPGNATEGQNAVVAQQMDQYRKGAEGNAYVDVNYRALRLVLERFREAGATVVIFEGRVNPSLDTVSSLELRERTRSQVAAMAQETGARYIPASEQDVDLEVSDWKDGSHLNASGRGKFTRYVLDVLRPMAPKRS